MTMKNIIIVMCLLRCFIGYSQNSIIELPIKIEDGYGPFKGGVGGVSFYYEEENNPWFNTYLHIKGLPAGWTEIQEGAIETDIYQTVYQNYHAGKITQEQYQELQNAWKWEPDSFSLHKDFIKNQIAFVYGKEESGAMKMIIDTNNNHDFSDDAIFSPVEVDLNSDMDNDSLFENMEKIRITYERLSNSKVIREKAPLVIFYAKPYNIFMTTFPQYAIAELNNNEIAVCFESFTNTISDKASIVIIDDSLKNGKKAKHEDKIGRNEFLIIENDIYKNMGFSKNKNALILEKIDLPKEKIKSTQIGFSAIPFEGKGFNTEEIFSLKDFQGKYLFVDFWAVWCGPCISEIPFLKTLYDSLDKSKIEFIGIVGGNSPANTLEQMTEKYSINWPQILSDETNKIIQTYDVSGYPTSFIINPQGVIVAKNLRGEGLKNKIEELLQEENPISLKE